jgi:hypothetical protein
MGSIVGVQKDYALEPDVYIGLLFMSAIVGTGVEFVVVVLGNSIVAGIVGVGGSLYYSWQLLNSFVAHNSAN